MSRVALRASRMLFKLTAPSVLDIVDVDGPGSQLGGPLLPLYYNSINDTLYERNHDGIRQRPPRNRGKHC